MTIDQLNTSDLVSTQSKDTLNAGQLGFGVIAKPDAMPVSNSEYLIAESMANASRVDISQEYVKLFDSILMELFHC